MRGGVLREVEGMEWREKVAVMVVCCAVVLEGTGGAFVWGWGLDINVRSDAFATGKLET